jgi:hypothetical protein
VTPEPLVGRRPGDDLVDHERRPADDVEVPDRPCIGGRVEDGKKERYPETRIEPLLDRPDVLARLDAVPLTRRQGVGVPADDPTLELLRADVVIRRTRRRRRRGRDSRLRMHRSAPWR